MQCPQWGHRSVSIVGRLWLGYLHQISTYVIQITGFTKLHTDLVVLLKKMSVLINFVLQNLGIYFKFVYMVHCIYIYVVLHSNSIEVVSFSSAGNCNVLAKYQFCVCPCQNLPKFCWSCLTGVTNFVNSEIKVFRIFVHNQNLDSTI
jgi:hypothetical protein